MIDDYYLFVLWYTGSVTEQYKRKPNTQCKICNKDIYKRPSQIILNKGRVFCSSTCYGKSCRDEKPCVICSKPILSSLHRKTCSRICSNKNRAGIVCGTERPFDKVKSQEILKNKFFHYFP